MLRIWRNLLRARDGLAAAEFAMLAPVLAALFLGSIEMCNALNAQQKAGGMASTAADLIAQETNVTNADISNVFAAVNAIMYPYPATNIQITISSLADNGHGGGTVSWSDAQNATARTVGSTVVVPAGVITSGGSVIFTEVTYPYSSTISDYTTGAINMTATFYSRPRRSATISRSAS